MRQETVAFSITAVYNISKRKAYICENYLNLSFLKNF